MRSGDLNLWRWACYGMLAGVLMLAGGGESRAAADSAYGSGTNNCSGCHGTVGTGTPPKLPSQVSNILVNANLNDSCSATFACDLRQKIAANATMGPAGANVSADFTATQLETVRQYLLRVKNAEVTNTAPAFASTVVGQTTTDTFTVNVRNYRGATVASTGSIGYSFTISGADYSIVSATAGTCTATGSTSPNTCAVSVTVRFSPSAAGPRSGSLGVNLSSAIGTDPAPVDGAVALSATGIAAVPGFSITPASRSFTAKIGTTASADFVISNPGTAPLDLTSFTFPSPRYTRDPASTCSTAANVAVGDNCTLTVVFAPTSAGAVNGTLSIAHNAAGSPSGVTLNGTGTQATVSASSTSLAFDTVQQGVPKTLPAITVTNTGNATLVFATNPTSPAALSGSGAADYSVASTCSTASPVNPAGSCTITVTFTPTVLAPRPATLTIASDATNSPLVVTLSGTGVALPEPVVTFPAQDFADTVIGENAAATRQVTIRNDRTRNIGYSVAETADFKIASESCAGRVVPGGGGTCTVNWRFSPTLGAGEGRRQATINFSFTGTLGDPAPSSIGGTLAGNALLPILQSATALDAAAVVGSPTTVSMLLTNRSASGVVLSSLAFSGAAPGDYSLDAGNTCVPAGTLAAGANCSLVIRFNPPTAGTRNATLTITHAAPGSPQTVLLRGAATPAPQGRIELSSLSLAFADTQLASSSTQSITVQNSGDLALTFSAFTLSGSAATDYERGGTCSTAVPLAIGAQCTLGVTFRPSALGTRSASLTIQSDASNGPATITLTGTGVPIPAPQVSLVPATLDFGEQTVGGLYPKRVVRLANSGTADLTVTALAVEGTAFADASATACPTTLVPGAGCDIEVRFSAAAPGIDYTGTVRVTSNAAGSPHTAALRGRGSAATLPVLVYSPAVSQLAFGTVSAGAVSAVQSVTLLNQGPGGVELTVLNAVGADAAAFSVSGGTCQVGQQLFEGQTCRIDVRFAPAASGDKSATVQIASTGSFPPTLSLSGTGLGGPSPGLAVSAAALGFDSTRVGSQSLPNELTLSSTGSGVVRITAMELSGPYTMQTKTCPALPFTLPAGGECTVVLSFVPQAEGDAAGSLRVTSSADPATREVALSGRGEAKADLSSGGCSMVDGESATDPTLWTLVLLAAVALLVRRRARAARRGRS